jgi:copper homeostasis protein
MFLEICANSYQSAINAQEAGAHRVELCQELSVGGITPSYGLIKQVIAHLKIPVFVLIRPRSGDFNYSDAEFEIIKKDIEISKELGCKGIVSGILHKDRTIDVERTKVLVERSKPLDFTFHRAFDEVVNPLEALDQLIDLGVNRILSSGQQPTAEEGLELLKQLHFNAKGRLAIMAGAGINASNAQKFKTIGLKEIHASASKKIARQYQSMFENAQMVSCVDIIKSILKAI